MVMAGQPLTSGGGLLLRCYLRVIIIITNSRCVYFHCSQSCMVDFFGILGIGTTAFVATNIDDLLILIAFFANSRFPLPQIVLGQYAGMGALLAIGLGSIAFHITGRRTILNPDSFRRSSHPLTRSISLSNSEFEMSFTSRGAIGR